MQHTVTTATASDIPAASGAGRWWLAAACAVFVADLLLHLPITDLCDGVVRRVGFDAFDTAVRRGFLGLAIAAVAAVAVRSGRRNRTLVMASVALAAAAIVFQRTLLVSGIENIHYPQYALVVWLLVQGGVHVEHAYLLGGGLGIADEAWQLATMPRGTPGYFDWNDVALNALGAAFGVVLTLAMARTAWRGPLVWRRMYGVVAAAAVIASLVLSPPVWSPFYAVTPGGRAFHRLAASEALLIAGCLWAGVRSAIAGTRSRAR